MKFGGHKAACGFTMETSENLEKLRPSLNEDVRGLLGDSCYLTGR